MPLLEVDSLKMYYEIEGRGWVKAVDGVSLWLEKGDSLGLAGESGCGKTSLAMTILKLLPSNGRIFGGKVIFDGENIYELSEEEFRRRIRWKSISIIPQGAMNALNPVVRVGDQIVEAILLHEDISREEAKERVKNLFKMVGLDPSRVNSYPHELSGGMRQRVMTAMALACNPKLVIADEPTTALDVIVQAQVLKLIKNLQTKFNLSLILITHDLSIISEICDWVAVMYAGKIVEYGPVELVYESPQHPYTRGLLAAVPSVKGKKRRLESIPGAPPDLLSPPTGCRFHPRCKYAEKMCMEEEPPLEKLEDGRFVACHKVGVLG